MALKKNSMETGFSDDRPVSFLEDLTGQASACPLSDPEQKKQQSEQFQRDLRILSGYLSLCCCRLVFLAASLLLAAAISIGQSHTPISLYGLLCYFFVYLILSEFTKKYKTQEFSLPSLRLRYHYHYSRLLTEQFSFWFSFVLLAALQYAFLHTVALDSRLLTYAPSAAALLLLLLRYLLPPLFRFFLKRQLMYQK